MSDADSFAHSDADNNSNPTGHNYLPDHGCPDYCRHLFSGSSVKQQQDRSGRTKNLVACRYRPDYSYTHPDTNPGDANADSD